MLKIENNGEKSGQNRGKRGQCREEEGNREEKEKAIRFFHLTPGDR